MSKVERGPRVTACYATFSALQLTRCFSVETQPCPSRLVFSTWALPASVVTGRASPHVQGPLTPAHLDPHSAAAAWPACQALAHCGHHRGGTCPVCPCPSLTPIPQRQAVGGKAQRASPSHLRCQLLTRQASTEGLAMIQFLFSVPSASSLGRDTQLVGT